MRRLPGLARLSSRGAERPCLSAQIKECLSHWWVLNMPCIVYIETIMIDRQDRAHPVGIRVRLRKPRGETTEDCSLSLGSNLVPHRLGPPSKEALNLR